nr:Nif3-like dinuclear metal center hexameric protein [Chitinispirillaceae bacterium]
MMKKTVSREMIVKFLDAELQTGSIEDVSRNGLQVEGSSKITRIALCVDACLEAYQAAASQKCQLVIAHHGMIWGGLPFIRGAVYKQLRFLVNHDMNLYASHLPLDLHRKHGNNAQIAQMLGLGKIKPFGNYHGTDIGCEGVLPMTLSLQALSAHLTKSLGGKNVVLPFGKNLVKSVGIVSGSAGELLIEAIDKNIDCYITGEPKHDHHHTAKEALMNVIYCGHYHSEKLGVMA